MDFDQSTQARSWLFDSRTLLQCRQRTLNERPMETTASCVSRVRKFASGFHGANTAAARETDFKPPLGSFGSQSCIDDCLYPEPCTRRVSALEVEEQELLIRFHAHQLTMLLGPHAVFQGLVKNQSVLATAIVLFRRFYLSNSVLDFEPRKIAVASAFLGSKVEDTPIELDLLERATAFIDQKVVTSSLGKQESYHVSSADILDGERALLEGLNYELRCHHPYNAIRVLVRDVTTFLTDTEAGKQAEREEARDPSNSFSSELPSPRRVSEVSKEERNQKLHERAIDVAQNALLFSDVPFLFTPGQLAFAAVAIALRNGRKTRTPENYVPLDPEMTAYLRARFPFKQEQDLSHFEHQVRRVAHQLDRSHNLDTKTLVAAQTEEPSDCSDPRSNQLLEIRRVSSKVLALVASAAHLYHRGLHSPVNCPFPRKRKDMDAFNFVNSKRIAKVTPTKR